MGLGFRYRFSGVTSLALALVLSLLPYVPPPYGLLNNVLVTVFLIDGLVKVFDFTPLRKITSALYSLALAVAMFTYFKVFGTPFSELFAFALLYDFYLKLVPGEQKTPFGSENYYRHVVSAIVTVGLGLGVLFGVSLPFFLNVILGLLILFDGVVKLEYVKIL